jgi:GNAT superfamily N-acetyltransferase
VSEVPPFVVFSMPRARSKWLSQFLRYGPWQVGHDEIRHCRSLDDVTSWLAQPFTGTVETAASSFWRLLPEGVRVVTVRRPVADVVASLRRGGLAFDDAVMTRAVEAIERKLDQIERRLPDVLAVTFADLAAEPWCARVFEHCLGLPHDSAWWAACARVNIQISLPHLMRYYSAHAAQMAKLVAVAKHRTIATMTRAAVEPPEGVTFQHEDARSFYRDAQHLFAEHLFQTGQSPDACDDKNWPLVFQMDDLGLIQTMTARSNGRIFGYLQTVIGPTFDAPGVVQAWHTIFFASPDVRGLGMKLQRAALARLREMGVDEVIMRAGVRGSGPRLGTFYRRLGAEDLGQLYRVGITRWDGQRQP